MKKLVIRSALVLVVLVIALVVILALSLGSVIKKGVETVGPQITKTEMKLAGANISILSGSGTLKGFLLGNPEGYKTPSAINVGEVSLGVRPKSVLSDKIHVTYVKVIAPEITFEGTLGTKNNLSKILENVDSVASGAKPADTGTGQPKSQPADSGASKKLQVDDFLISGAKVSVSMTMLGGKSLTVPIPDIHFTQLGAGPEGITAAELTKRVLNEVTVATLKAVEKGVADLGKGATEAVKDASKTATDTLDKAKGVGDLFKKK
jgi:hypothetical protein